jgi:internalin A
MDGFEGRDDNRREDFAVPVPSEARPWWRGPRVRLSLRALMIAVLILGGWLGWLVRGARIQREAVAAIQRGGGSVRYDWEWASFRYLPDGRLVQPMPKPGTKPPWPEWLVARLGPDYFGSVKEVVVGPNDFDLVMPLVARLERLESFRVAVGSSITDEGLRHIRGLTGLESFSISPRATRITAACLESLEGLTGLRRLFFTTHPPLTDADLGRLRNLKALQELQLPGARGGRITDAGLAPVAGFTALQNLSLGATPITDAGLAHLRGLTGLAELDLYKTRVTDAGLAHLAGLKSLRRLTLADTRVTDAGLAHLAGLGSLQRVSLYQTGITDAGLAHLARIPSLTSLNLCKTPITDAGLAHLAGLEGLTSLMVEGSRVTDAGIAALQAALPGVKIARPASIGAYR